MRIKLIAAIVLAVGSAVSLSAQVPRPPGSTRTDLQRHDLSIPGWEALQARVDIEPGASFPAHSHPGEEIIYVLEGTFEYGVAGKPVRVSAGEVLFIPAGVSHSARNVGEGTASELATYVVEKGKPLVTYTE
jgi:quercetin dioxygenase-like cupin family protein